MALVKRKVESGHTQTVTQPFASEAPASKSAAIIDLTELLKRSLKGGTGAKPAPKKAPAKTLRTA